MHRPALPSLTILVIFILSGIYFLLEPAISTANPVRDFHRARTSQELQAQVNALEKKINGIRQRLTTQQEKVAEIQQRRQGAEKQIWAAIQGLEDEKRPVRNAMESFNHVHQQALVDPAISTEDARLVYLAVKTRTEAAIQEREDKLDQLKNILAQVDEELGSAQLRVDETKSEIESLKRTLHRANEVTFMGVSKD
ncbi:MAG: hypothetical protein HQL54_06300 [Magnetococcales bacterium]|nr:hypothetical protein [Magnetococcales bacterium]